KLDGAVDTIIPAIHHHYFIDGWIILFLDFVPYISRGSRIIGSKAVKEIARCSSFAKLVDAHCSRVHRGMQHAFECHIPFYPEDIGYSQTKSRIFREHHEREFS